ncbi:hypothetical protein [Sporosarcina sp. FSL K6-3457]|uniref:hypothetical protein n=1 Tax=Sporosarcina sp. FSL K6-3457 TaxID=2978204 RepID=UPI0030F50C2F
MNIPLSMLFEEQSQNNDKSSILFLKQRCRNPVYTKNYASFSFLLDELSDSINKNREVIKEDKLFLIWHKAIVIHRLKSEPEKAKELLIKHIPQKAILETELSMLNSLGLICKSLGQKKEASDYFAQAFEGVQFNNQYDDPTLPVRVGYNYASQLFYKEKYLQVIAITNSSNEYLDMNYLSYMRGRNFYILARAYEKIEDYSSAEKYMKIAIDIFTSEGKPNYKEKASKDLEQIASKREI